MGGGLKLKIPSQYLKGRYFNLGGGAGGGTPYLPNKQQNAEASEKVEIPLSARDISTGVLVSQALEMSLSTNGVPQSHCSPFCGRSLESTSL